MKLKLLHNLFVLSCLATLGALARAATITSAGTGNWSVGGTWAGGVVPTSADTAVIANGSIVTVDITTAAVQAVTVKSGGTLKFSRGASSTLTVSAGNVTVNGTLDMGRSGDAILLPSTATLVLPSGASAGEYGLNVAKSGQFYMQGSPKNPVALATANVSAGVASLTVNAADAAGWGVGDVIVIGQTELPNPWANQCEKRTIKSDPSGGTIQWDAGSPLLFNHLAHLPDDNNIRVANLTRNVRVISAGTNHATNSSYVLIQAQPGNAVLSLGEFSELGSSVNEDDPPGIEVWNDNGTAGVVMSSCSVHDGYEGVVFEGGAGAGFYGNIFYGSQDDGMDLTGGLTMVGNDFMANGDYGFSLGWGTDGLDFDNNNIYANPGEGLGGYAARSSILNSRIFANANGSSLGGWDNPSAVDVIGNRFYRNGNINGYAFDTNFTNALIQDNLFYGNAHDGAIVGGSSNTVTGNVAYNNVAGYGFGLECQSVIFSSNTAYGNDTGIWFYGSTDGWIVDNRIYGNSGDGVYTYANNARNRVVGGAIYSNGDVGVHPADGASIFLQDVSLGYTPAGVSAPDPGGEFYLGQYNGDAAVLRGCKVGSGGGGINAAGTNQLGNSLFVQSSVNEPGVTRAWGDVVLASDLTLDYAQPSWPAQALAPRLMRGIQHSATVNSVNAANAVSQVVTIRYDGSRWQVEGSSTGAMGSFTNGTPVSNTPFPTVSPQFNLTFTHGPLPQTNDRVDFLLLAQAGDAGTDKSLLVHSPAAGFPNGRSRLTVPSGVALTLKGRATQAAVMNTSNSGTPYFTFLASGTVTMSSAAVSNTDSDGLQFGTAATVSMSSVTFDYLGDNASTRSYVTAQSLTSNTSFYSLTINNSRAIGANGYSVRVLGPDAGLHWDVMSYAGPKAGDGTDYDPHGCVRWADILPPSAATPTATAGIVEGQILLTWNSPGDDGVSGPLNPGQYRIYASTTQSQAQTATYAQAQVVQSTTAAAGSPQSWTFNNLMLETTYYYRVWALDEWNNPGPNAGVLASTTPFHPSPQPPAVTAGVAAGEVLLTWTAPATPPAAYLDHFEIQESTTSSGGPFQALTSPVKTDTSYSHTGLLPETTYYYQMRTVDTGGTASGWAATQAYTPDNQGPVAVNDLAATPGSAQGTVQLTFTFRGDNGGSKTLEAGGAYRVQYATFTVGVVWSTASAQAVMPSGSVLPGTVVTQTVGGFTQDGTYYFRIWTVDKWGNASGMDTTLPQASAVPRTQSPQASLSPLDSSAAAYPWTQAFTVSFTKAIDPTTLTGFHVVKVRDRLGNAVNQAVAGSTSAAGTDSYQFTPATALDGNSLYEVRVTTTVKDTQGNPLAQAVTGRYLTFMHHGEDNVATDGVSSATIHIPAGALAADGYLASGTAPSQIAAATQKLAANNHDSYQQAVGAGPAALAAFDSAGASQPGLSSPVTVSMPFTDSDGDGIVDHTSPPARVRTLAIYWLNETDGVWVRLPSTVDTSRGLVSASVPRMVPFALFASADADIAQAYAYPVPFVPGRGKSTVTFVNAGQGSVIRIYTPAGILVRELTADSFSLAEWDLKTSGGSAAAPGVYLYKITNGSSVKTGKLAVLR